MREITESVVNGRDVARLDRTSVDRVREGGDLQEWLRGAGEGRPAEEILGWAIRTYRSKIALASSFGAEDVVLIDMWWRIDPDVRVFTLDTGRLPEETYEVMERIRQRYGIAVVTYFPKASAVEALEKEQGYYSFRRSVEERKHCCGIRKVEPLRRALASLGAWVTGLRREQAVSRTGVAVLEWDEAHGLVKVNPLASWTESQVWAYIAKHDVPHNVLHDRGYPSIGCAPCTRAIQPGEDIRAGRWWWENPENKECGLHVEHNGETARALPGFRTGAV
jgi:phosphoadenosine phosphosulfate reductase